jgi:hypothetical protein
MIPKQELASLRAVLRNEIKTAQRRIDSSTWRGNLRDKAKEAHLQRLTKRHAKLIADYIAVTQKRKTLEKRLERAGLRSGYNEQVELAHKIDTEFNQRYHAEASKLRKEVDDILTETLLLGVDGKTEHQIAAHVRASIARLREIAAV